jgi:uncharacterized membrane protein YhaH (DUF805 family)
VTSLAVPRATRSAAGAPRRSEPTSRQVLLRIALACLLARVLLEAVGLASAYAHDLDVSGRFLTLWSQWDAGHYLRIAEVGYRPEGTPGDDHLFIVFFPGYPVAVAAIALVVRDGLVAGLLVSYAASVGACWFLYRLVRLDGDHREATRAVLLLLCAPTAYFMAAPFSEALFLCAVLGAVYAARCGSWARAGLACAAAAATRVVGIALVPALVVRALAGWFAGRRAALVACAWAGIGSLGLIAYLAINKVVYGDPTHFMDVQREHWFHRTVPPWDTVREAVLGLRTGAEGDLRFIYAWRLAALAVVVPLLLVGLRRLRAADSVYAWTALALMTSTTWLLSLPRYVLVLYPLYLVAAKLTRREAILCPVLAACVVLQGWLFYRYSAGAWTF